jgi:hypothetical protein
MGVHGPVASPALGPVVDVGASTPQVESICLTLNRSWYQITGDCGFVATLALVDAPSPEVIAGSVAEKHVLWVIGLTMASASRTDARGGYARDAGIVVSNWDLGVFHRWLP